MSDWSAWSAWVKPERRLVGFDRELDGYTGTTTGFFAVEGCSSGFFGRYFLFTPEAFRIPFPQQTRKRWRISGRLLQLALNGWRWPWHLEWQWASFGRFSWSAETRYLQRELRWAIQRFVWERRGTLAHQFAFGRVGSGAVLPGSPPAGATATQAIINKAFHGVDSGNPWITVILIYLDSQGYQVGQFGTVHLHRNGRETLGVQDGTRFDVAPGQALIRRPRAPPVARVNRRTIHLRRGGPPVPVPRGVLRPLVRDSILNSLILAPAHQDAAN
ncbi:hypothetical protein BU26DRAFT_558240 [Trematosphaeria pertusa]|uniref:Uncharacterized protein n=1 Tax=Trematosphaeria pertusa TaxID=390896 RepID=A0A6A6J1Y1_9PLEO|nr:uncharacterized protein BU26DRAFT_558240 [Trematosphaeria pertusa]KAF2256804.1 hypothetical protein BU26DRAFT_558240 [Trematosphaeria pertusa]